MTLEEFNQAFAFLYGNRKSRQADMAKAIGKSQETVSRYANGKRPIDRTVVILIRHLIKAKKESNKKSEKLRRKIREKALLD